MLQEACVHPGASVLKGGGQQLEATGTKERRRRTTNITSCENLLRTHRAPGNTVLSSSLD